MLKCHCNNGPEYTRVEKVMAEKEGLDLHVLHLQMDTWERYAMQVLDGGDPTDVVDTGKYSW